MKQYKIFPTRFLLAKKHPILIAIWGIFITLSASAQVQKVEANGITIAYESLGNPENETILLIAGTGMQLTTWPSELCDKLVQAGYQVLCFDNRDVGLSTKMTDAPPLNWPAIIQALQNGEPAPIPYTVDDMAQDAVTLLDALSIPKAHIVGVSGGAIIAQIVAAKYPKHVWSLTSLMGTTGNPALPPIKPELQNFILSLSNPAPTDTAAIVDRKVKIFQALGSPAYPRDEGEIRGYVLRDVKRCYYQAGEDRQGSAALVAGDRRDDLKTIKVPVVVVHGKDDPIVPVEA